MMRLSALIWSLQDAPVGTDLVLLLLDDEPERS
jgi:hypothetical protein